MNLDANKAIQSIKTEKFMERKVSVVCPNILCIVISLFFWRIVIFHQKIVQLFVTTDLRKYVSQNIKHVATLFTKI